MTSGFFIAPRVWANINTREADSRSLKTYSEGCSEAPLPLPVSPLSRPLGTAAGAGAAFPLAAGEIAEDDFSADFDGDGDADGSISNVFVAASGTSQRRGGSAYLEMGFPSVEDWLADLKPGEAEPLNAWLEDNPVLFVSPLGGCWGVGVLGN